MTLTRRLVMLAALSTLGTPAVAQTVARTVGPVRFVLAPDGNEARYRVREQLVNIDFPSDAVGRTSALTGSLFIGPDGLVKDSSRFAVDLTTIASDRPNRDRYIRRNSLNTDQFPQAVLVPTGFKGLVFPLPAKGPVTFQLVGEFTVRGVTRRTTWEVTAEMNGTAVEGTAITSFTFTDFAIPVPRVPLLLSVRDTIRVEYDFRLVRGS